MNISTWIRRSMEVSCSAAGNAGGETTTFEAVQQLPELTTHSSVCVRSMHATSPDDTNSPLCQVPSGISVNKVADYLDHRLTEKTSAGLADSAVDVTATCPDEPRTRPASDCFTSDLLELLMHDTIDPADSSVYPDRTAICDRDQDLLQKSDLTEHSMNGCDSLANTAFEIVNRCCESTYKSDQLIRDSGDAEVKCKTSDDDITTRSSLDEQLCDSPSSGISSCSVVTADYPDEVTGDDFVHKRDIIADNTAKYIGAHHVESTCDAGTVGGNATHDPAEFRHSIQYCVCGDVFDMHTYASHKVECVHIDCTNREASITVDTAPIIGLDQCKEQAASPCFVAESAHGATDVAADSVPRNAAHKQADTYVKIKNVRPGIPATISLCALKQQHVGSSDNIEQSRHATRVNYDARTEGVTVSNADQTRASLAMSSDSDVVPCGGSRHSTNDGKQYINVPTSPSTKDSPHRDGRVSVRSATVKQCGRPGSRIQVQVELGDKKMDQLQRHDVHRLLDRGDSRWRCDAHRGPHVLLLTLLCAPLALAISFVISLYMGTICCYNVLCYTAAEGSTAQKALRCPIIVLTYPFVVFGTALGIGMYAGGVQVSWNLVRWRREFADYEKGFYGWLCTNMDMVQCAPYGVIVLEADFAIETLEPSQDDTEL